MNHSIKISKIKQKLHNIKGVGESIVKLERTCRPGYSQKYIATFNFEKGNKWFSQVTGVSKTSIVDALSKVELKIDNFIVALSHAK